jgi:hypothetical protein
MKPTTKNILKTIVVLVVFLFVNSCKKDSTDFDKFNGYNPSPEFGIPLFNSKITMLNLIKNDTVNITVDNTGLVHFAYRKDSIFNYKINDFFKFESPKTTPINNTLGELSVNNVSNSKTTTLQELSASFNPATKLVFDGLAGNNAVFPEITESINTMKAFDAFTEFSSVKFSDGWLVITISNYFPINLNTINLNLYNLTPTEQLLGTFNYSNIAPGTSKSDSIPLAGITLSASLGYKMPVFNTNSSAPTAVLINYSDSLVFKSEAKNLKAISGVAVIPNQSILNQPKDIDFTPNDANQRIRKLKLAGGKIKISAQSTFNESLELTINFTSATKNGLPYPSQVITVPNTGTSSFYIDSSINLAGVSLNLTQNGLKPYNIVPITYSAKVISSGLPVSFSSTDYINLDLSTTSTTIDYVEGYFGQIDIPNAGDQFIDLSFLDIIKSGLNLDEPELKITINNQIGVPLQFQYNFIGKNKNGDSVDAQLKPFDFNYPTIAEQGQIKNTVQIYSNKNNNGKINELLSLPPNKIQILGKLVTNAEQDPTKNQFIKQGDAINVNIEMDIPMVFRSTALTLVDSSKFDVKQFDQFKEVTLSLNIENYFPFEANMKIVFMNDSNNIAIDSMVFNKIITSAITNANGKTIQGASSKTKITMSEALLNKLKNNKVNKIKTYSSLLTENNGTKSIKLYSDYEMKISLGIIASLKK